MSSPLLECDIGDVVVISDTITDQAGQPVTGATVVATSRSPLGIEADLTVSDEGGGVYSARLIPDSDGIWHVRFSAAPPSQAREEAAITVRATRFANP